MGAAQTPSPLLDAYLSALPRAMTPELWGALVSDLLEQAADNPAALPIGADVADALLDPAAQVPARDTFGALSRAFGPSGLPFGTHREWPDAPPEHHQAITVLRHALPSRLLTHPALQSSAIPVIADYVERHTWVQSPAALADVAESDIPLWDAFGRLAAMDVFRFDHPIRLMLGTALRGTQGGRMLTRAVLAATWHDPELPLSLFLFPLQRFRVGLSVSCLALLLAAVAVRPGDHVHTGGPEVVAALWRQLRGPRDADLARALWVLELLPLEAATWATADDLLPGLMHPDAGMRDLAQRALRALPVPRAPDVAAAPAVGAGGGTPPATAPGATTASPSTASRAAAEPPRSR